jgi:catechol 2,3-dioxygenase-like lactoylglutathione lyase family enzyme
LDWFDNGDERFHTRASAEIVRELLSVSTESALPDRWIALAFVELAQAVEDLRAVELGPLAVLVVDPLAHASLTLGDEGQCRLAVCVVLLDRSRRACPAEVLERKEELHPPRTATFATFATVPNPTGGLMLASSEAVAFLPSEDLERSERFFQGVLDLPLVNRSPYASVFTVGGGTLRITKVNDLRPQTFTVFGWIVQDVRATVNELRDRGTVMLRYEELEQDDHGVWTTPSGDFVAWFHDPDTNVLSLTQLTKS